MGCGARVACQSVPPSLRGGADQRKPRLQFHYDLVRGRLSDTVWHGPAWAVLRDARESAPLDKIGWSTGRASEIQEQ
jgi:hypothetical protein